MPALRSLVPCNSLVSKFILNKTAKDQGCFGIKGANSPLPIALQLQNTNYFCQGNRIQNIITCISNMYYKLLVFQLLQH